MSTKYAKRVTPLGIPNTRLADLPDLIEVQKKSFEWFLKEGLKEEFLSYSPIKDYTGRLELHFLPNYTFDNPKYTEEEARIHDATYAKQLRVMVRLVNRDTGEIIEQEVYIKIWKNSNRYVEKNRLTQWIFTITSNTCRDYLKSKNVKNAKNITSEDGVLELQADTKTPEKIYQLK